jgi:hypothetical protein
VAANDTTLYTLDGIEIRRADVNRIDPVQIETVRHWIGPARTLRGRSSGDIVEIVTKGSADRPSAATPLFILDGREIPAVLGRVLDANKIARVEVLKRAAAQPYGERAQNGVILVTSKAGSDQTVARH